eukprot:358487-Chlamydomonas_euryale.AAC.10
MQLCELGLNFDVQVVLLQEQPRVAGGQHRISDGVNTCTAWCALGQSRERVREVVHGMCNAKRHDWPTAHAFVCTRQHALAVHGNGYNSAWGRSRTDCVAGMDVHPLALACEERACTHNHAQSWLF